MVQNMFEGDQIAERQPHSASWRVATNRCQRLLGSFEITKYTKYTVRKPSSRGDKPF